MLDSSQIITVTIHQVMSAAFEYAKLHAAERTAEALAALAEPEESSFVLGVAAGMLPFILHTSRVGDALTICRGSITCSALCYSIYCKFNRWKLRHGEPPHPVLMFEHS